MEGDAVTDFTVKDSGARMEFESGMVRDTEDNKTDYSLVLDGPMFDRWAEHLTKGAKKYAPRNWMKATGEAELDRFKRSALRHFLQWYRGETDEDHAAAVMFNINGAEYVKSQESEPKVTLNLVGSIGPEDASGWAIAAPGAIISSTISGHEHRCRATHMGWSCLRHEGHDGPHLRRAYIPGDN